MSVAGAEEWEEQGAEEMVPWPRGIRLGCGFCHQKLGAASPFPRIRDLFLLLGEEEACGPSGLAFLLIQS